MKKLIVVVASALVAAMVLSAAPAMAAQNVTLCHVNIGDEASEDGHDLDGWGPIEPYTHSGNWGGFDTSGENCRVIWDTGDDDPSATITLDRCCQNGAAKAIIVRHLGGIADDSFTIEVKDNHGKWVEIGDYEDEPGANEEWFETRFALPNGKKLQLGRGLEVEVRLTATGEAWYGFNTYGQVAFDWIKLEGNGRGCGNCCNCGSNNLRFNWMNHGNGRWFR